MNLEQDGAPIVLYAKADKLVLSPLAHKLNLYASWYIDELYGLAYIRDMKEIDLARDPKLIGNSIRNARKRMGMSQYDLANKVGLRQGTISLIESGKPGSKIETLLAILSALGLEFQIAPRSRASKRNPESNS
jgi:HTH-type transcriptional regulator / antitoxin HipB